MENVELEKKKSTKKCKKIKENSDAKRNKAVVTLLQDPT